MCKDTEKVFLATTALDEFWDKNKKIVFLTEGCKRYSQRQKWEHLNYNTLVHPWDKDINKYYEQIEYINKLINDIFPYLADSLNSIHNTNYSERFWRTVVGLWFANFSNLIYNSYLSLKAFINQYPNFETIVLDEESFIVPTTYHSFVESIIPSDAYNLQIYSQILSEIGYDFPKKKLNHIYNIELGFDFNYKRIITKFRQFLIYKIYVPVTDALRRNTEIVIHTLPLTRTKTLLLNFIMQNNTSSYIGNFEKYFRKPLAASNLDVNLRNTIKLQYKAKNEFERILCNLIFRSIPSDFLENYSQIFSECANIYKKSPSPKMIVSGKSWYGDTYFNLWAALCREKYNTILIGVQHGGHNGSIKLFADEFFSPDGYITWGFDVSNLNEEMDTQNLKYNIGLAVKLFCQKKLELNPANKSILFIGTCSTRFNNFFCCLKNARNYRDYLDSQYKFVDSLSKDLYPKLTMRIRNYDYGWDVVDRYRDKYPDLHLDLWNKSYYQALDDCRICVIDHMSTTYVEALYSNKPTILFWGENEYDMITSATPFYNKLHAVGILHYSPESAAKYIADIYDNVNEWWMEPERQAAVNEFCNEFAYIPPKPLRTLKSEINKILPNWRKHEAI